MKKCFYMLAAFLLGSTVNAFAAPGDTTWVQAHKTIQMPNYGNYDTSIQFPDGSTSYRKVYMIFTMGKYVCPGNPQYCGDWDYDVHNILMTPAGDTFEIARLITPYAHTDTGPFKSTWNYRYIFDVTDYYPLLKNSATMRILYSGYSGGFTGDVKFAFVEGTPERNVLKVDRLWHGGYDYGHGPVDINTALGTMSKTAPAGTQSAEMKLILTGHGGDISGGAEFLPNTYTVNLNSNQLLQQNFWRDDCGKNPLYPQSGTWIYDRANWCPGALVNTYSHVLTGVTANSNYSLGLTFPAYTSTTDANHPNAASYKIDAAVVYYGALNQSVDAAIVDIINPSNFEGHFRENAMCGNPTVRVRNSGSTTITSIKFEYGVVGSDVPGYNWTGSIAPLQEQEIVLPEPWALRVATGTNNTFSVKIAQVNGSADGDLTNNQMQVGFTGAPTWNVKTRIVFKTNAVGGETRWKIYDLAGNIVAQREGTDANTIYRDTLTLGPACYKMVVEDDGCDGLYFWANTGAGAGYVQAYNLGSTAMLPLAGYFNRDFGCGFTQYFKTAWPTAITNYNPGTEANLQLYPNPAQQSVTVNIGGVSSVHGTIQFVDATGRIVYSQATSQTQSEINTSRLANGIYQIIFADHAGNTPKLQGRLVIAK